MSVMYLLLPLSLLFATAAVVVFLWAARHGQFDDLETPAARILEDDDDRRRAVSTGKDTLPFAADRALEHRFVHRG